jgi:hypothetical protein
MSHLLYTIFNFILNCIFLQQHMQGYRLVILIVMYCTINMFHFAGENTMFDSKLEEKLMTLIWTQKRKLSRNSFKSHAKKIGIFEAIFGVLQPKPVSSFTICR